MIGNPTDKPVSWEAVRQGNGSLTSSLFSFGGSTLFQTSPQMEPFKGYYFYNATGLQSLKIVYPFAARPAKSSPDIPFMWKLQIVFETPQFTDAGNVLGVVAAKDVEVEGLNQRKPPSFMEQPSLYFRVPESNDIVGRYTSDFRTSLGDGEVWNFETHNPLLSTAKITLLGIEEVPPEFDVILINRNNSAPNDMRKNATYAYRATAQDMSFQLIVGKKSFTEAKLAEEIPKEFSLDQNYPNPFNPTTVIHFSVPSQARVRIDMFSTLGQRVVTLVDTWCEPGSYSVVWDGMTANGARASSGPYFYRMFVNDKIQATKRMMLVK
jgi:hypothetical protein